MRALRRADVWVLGAVLATLVAAPTPAVPAEPSAIDACLARLDPQLDIGYGRIAAKCPDVILQLERDPGAAWLPRGWKESANDLSPGGLKEYRALLEREQAIGPVSRAPNVRQVARVLGDLSGSLSESRWSQFKSWLRTLFERDDEPTGENWAAKMISHIGMSEWLIRMVVVASLGGVVALALVILVSELRTAGWLGRGRRVRQAPDTGESIAGMQTLEAADLERAPVLDRPRLLLVMLIRRLSERGLITAPKALTVRELTAAARLADPEDAIRLAEVALTAERVTYAARTAEVAPDSGDSSDMNAVVARGRELLERLQADRRA